MQTDIELLTEITERDAVVTHHFNAPRAKVFEAWTTPELLSKWYGPHNTTIPVCKMDVRPGGKYRIVMRMEGDDYPGKGEYRAVVPPDLLVYTANLEEHPKAWFDEFKKHMRPGDEGSPKDSVTAVDFEDENGMAKVTVHMRFETKAVRDAMINMGMPDAWEQCFQRLDTLLSSAN